MAGWIAVCLAVLPAAAAKLDISLPADAPDGIEDRLRAASLVALAIEDESATAQDLIAAAGADYARLTGALYDAGHFGATLSIRIDGREVAELPILAQPGEIGRIEIAVDPGPAFRFDATRIAPLAPGTDLPGGFAPGEPARSAAIRAAATAGIDGWRDAGHAKARVADQTIVADHARARLSADLVLAPGPRLRFGALSVTGNERVRTDRVRAIAGLAEGETFSPAELRRVGQRLRRTGAFASVALSEAERPGPDGTLGIEAELVEEKPRRLGFGAEISSVEGGRLSAFWFHRNIFGGAERLRLDGEIAGLGGQTGGEDYSLGARLSRPATPDPDTSAYLAASVSQTDDPAFVERLVGAGAGLTRYFSPQLEGSAGVSLTYYDIEDDNGERDFLLLTLPVAATWDNRDMALDATRGVYLSGEGLPFTVLDGETAGARLTADARAYRALGAAERVVLAGRLQLGTIFGADAEELPPGSLFFSGGGGTVRGQPYQSLGGGPDGDADTGGLSFLGLSGELRVRTAGAFGVVAFADAGFVGRDSVPGQEGEWQSGAGIGLRYDTGIGPIRLDLATPVSGPGDNDGVEIYIGIGQAF